MFTRIFEKLLKYIIKTQENNVDLTVCSVHKINVNVIYRSLKFRNGDCVFKTFHNSYMSGYDMNTDQFCSVFLGNNDTNDTHFISAHPLIFLAQTQTLFFLSLEIHAQVRILWSSWRITPSDTARYLNQSSFSPYMTNLTVMQVYPLEHQEDPGFPFTLRCFSSSLPSRARKYNMLLHFIRLLQLILN